MIHPVDHVHPVQKDLELYGWKVVVPTVLIRLAGGNRPYSS